MMTLLDGATSTNIIHNETCIEKHLLIHPEDLENLHKEYKEAGSVAVLAPTFLSNRYYLKEHGLEDRVHEINTFLVSLSKWRMSSGIASLDPFASFLKMSKIYFACT